jgi:hypothetical protein
MGCNCGKNKRVHVRFKLVMPDGKTTYHGTERSAQLANDRNGGGGSISIDR